MYCRRFLFLPLLLIVLLAGCTSLTAERDPPIVSLENFRALPSEGGAPRFEIVLRIANPNKEALDIAGIAYTVSVRERKLISGVSNEVPRIEGYSEETVTMQAGLELFQLLRLLADLGMEATDSLDYSFSAKIDFRGFIPTQRVAESGTLKLR
ncbi:LEA type 2 family protein [Haliea sp. E17]|uniref:LEA type 2 family protein n=1 Tax=Haliea sp. E17 TaxID=3401576 RepID=UPI003AAB36F2